MVCVQLWSEERFNSLDALRASVGALVSVGGYAAARLLEQLYEHLVVAEGEDVSETQHVAVSGAIAMADRCLRDGVDKYLHVLAAGSRAMRQLCSASRHNGPQEMTAIKGSHKNCKQRHEQVMRSTAGGVLALWLHSRSFSCDHPRVSALAVDVPNVACAAGEILCSAACVATVSSAAEYHSRSAKVAAALCQCAAFLLGLVHLGLGVELLLQRLVGDLGGLVVLGLELSASLACLCALPKRESEVYGYLGGTYDCVPHEPSYSHL
eukprot:m51a1_g7219 putative replication factor c 37 kda family protein (266) ;mRNA; r:626-3932